MSGGCCRADALTAGPNITAEDVINQPHTLPLGIFIEASRKRSTAEQLVAEQSAGALLPPMAPTPVEASLLRLTQQALPQPDPLEALRRLAITTNQEGEEQ
jgi:hypothetical protein